MRYYVLAINPEPWAIGDVGAGRNKASGKLYSYVSPNHQLKSFQEAVREELESQYPEKLEGEIRLCFWFWRQVAEYKDTDDKIRHRHQADLTNLTKGAEDACQGILFDNDRQVVSGAQEIVAQGLKVKPGVIIGIEVAPTVRTHLLPHEVIKELTNQWTEPELSDNVWRGPGK
jgi:Holliday junction resolvase RusA-like endonuclease